MAGMQSTRSSGETSTAGRCYSGAEVGPEIPGVHRHADPPRHRVPTLPATAINTEIHVSVSC